MPVAVRIQGPLDVNILRRSIEAIIQRHESLRTHFSAIDGVPTQDIEPEIDVDFPQKDNEESFDSDEVVQRIRESIMEPFDLNQGPLIRARIWRIDSNNHVLALPMHHIVSDGWSLGVLLRELGSFYDAFTANKDPQLTLLPIQYADYAAWQRAWLETPAAEKQRDYWMARDWDDTAMDAIGNTPQSNDTVIGATHTFNLPIEIAARATTFAQTERITPFMLLLSVFNLLLHRYTGCEAINIGTPVAGREQIETRGLIGFFINTVVIRTELESSLTFRDLLQRIRRSSLESFDNQQYPFEKVVEAVHPDRQLEGSPLFRVMFALQNAPIPSLQFAGLELSPIDIESGTAKFDLFLEIEATNEGLRASFSYNTARFDADFINGMSQHYVRLIENAIAHPDHTLAELDLLDTSNHQRLTQTWQGELVDYSSTTLHGLLSSQVSRTPDAVAVLDESTALTYAELDSRANGLAHELVAQGVGPETLVGVYMDRSVELVVALYGILKAGGAYVPLDPGYPEARLAYMLEDADAPVVLTQTHLQNSVPQGYEGRVVCVDTLTREESAAPILDTDDNRLAYVIYTSGSTGQPKGVMNEHRGVVNRILWMQDAYQIDGDDAVLQKTPFSFDVSVWEFFWPLSVGAKLVMAKPEGHKDPAYLAETIAREHITTIHFVPSMLQAFLDAADTSQCTTLRRVICSGEALSVPLHDQFFSQMNCELHNLYGPTEAAVDVTHWACTPTPGLTNVPIGRPITNTQTYVLDDHMNPVPIGVPGELYLGGVQVARGYWGQAALTSERFIEDPFTDTPGARLYKTGDRCRWRVDGAIEFLGRLDTQIKIRGFRIESGEIESTLRQHDGIHHAVVDTKTLGGEAQLVAYLVADSEIPATELRTHICATLPDHMAPQAYVYLDALPLTPSGKLDHKALPEPQTPESAATYAAPRNDAETTLVELWQTLLQTEPIGINDNFFELGGHSLKAVQLANRVGTQFQLKLPVRTIFESPTIAGLAERIARQSNGANGSLESIPSVDQDASPQLSFAQQRLWFLDQLDTQRAAYNIPAVVHIDGELNVRAMHQAIIRMTDRHETLRTVFIEQDGRPVPHIQPDAEVPFEEIDLQNLEPTERDARIHELITQETNEPFNFQTGPLIRAKVITVHPNEFRLLVTIHHIAADGWSLGVIVRELRAFYAVECERDEKPLPALPIQYRDYAAWQNQRLANGDMDSQVEYWQSQLDDVPVLELPTDRPRPTITTHAGATHHFTIPTATNDAISRVSNTLDATPFMTLLTAFTTLLSRVSGQTDIAVGSPIAGRTDESLENLIGLFVNTLVLRTDCSGNPRFNDLVRRVRDVTMSAYENQDVPFERLVEILQPDRQLNQNPLFQVMFVLQNAPLPPLELPGLKMTPVYAEGDTAKFDITVVLRESVNGLDAHIEYNTDLFDAETITAFADRYVRILETISTKPDVHLAELPILSQSENELVLNAWNVTTASFPSDTTTHALFERHVVATPTAIAVSMREKSLTYKELDDLANNIACHLANSGVLREELIGICIDRGIETVAVVLGIWKAGAAYIPLDPEYPEDRIAFMVRDSGMTTVITSLTYREQMDALGVSTVLATELFASPDESPPIPQPSPTSLAYAIYTSGSTGNPKAALIEHRSACNLAETLRKRFDVGTGFRWLQFAPFSFDAWVADILLTVCNGATLCIAPADERIGEPLADLLERDHINGALFPPSTLSVLPQRPYRDLRVLVSGGEACPSSIVNRWASGRIFINAYGPTEATVISTLHECDGHDAIDPPIGAPIANYRAYVLDPNGAPVPPGSPGELYVGGIGIARGYLNRAELTQERFLTDPFVADDDARMYRTGDLVRHRSDGNLIFTGRTDHQVKVRGFRIELGDIESTMRSHRDVEDAVCIIEHPGTASARIIAYAQVGGNAITAASLRAHIADHLPAHMIPNLIQTIVALPRTPNGKVNRKALPTPEGSTSRGTDPPLIPQTELERSIADVWATLLNVTDVSIRDNFFESGGHSLLAITFVSRLHDQGIKLSLQQVFENPTIEEMATAISSTGPDSTSINDDSIAMIQPKGDAHPLFAIPPASGILFPYFHLAHLLGPDRPFLGLRDPALEPNTKPFTSVEAYATHYTSAIRRVQPTGPYHLIGWSLGGTIAFEMARQLEEHGESVKFLGMIDTRIPEPDLIGLPAKIRTIAQRLTVGVNTAVSVPAHLFNGLYVKATGALHTTDASTVFTRAKRRFAAITLRILLRRSEFARLLPREYDQLETALPNFTAVPGLLRAHNKIAGQYTPGTYDGTVSLFRAEELVRGEREHPSPSFGWADVAESAIVYLVPGNHANMMSEPQIRMLAESIGRTLRDNNLA